MAASAVEKALGKRVAELRKAAKLTQAGLAEKVGVGVETISRLERGASIPPLDRLHKIARVLGADLHDLFAPRHESKVLSDLVTTLRPRKDAEISLVVDIAQRVVFHLDRQRSGRKG